MTKYFKVNPRGFGNEYLILSVPEDKVDEVNKVFDGWSDREFDRGNTNAYADWIEDYRATLPGVAVSWEDRFHALPQFDDS